MHFTLLIVGLLIIVGIISFWSLCLGVLILWKRKLLYQTWQESYLKEPVVMIESDDWGPGPANHSKALKSITDMLLTHSDYHGRPAVFTANIVLSVPNASVIRSNDFKSYARTTLGEGFSNMLTVFRKAIQQGVLVPQLHGREHFFPEGLMGLARSGRQDIRDKLTEDGWSDWETLESPLQAHYVDCSSLPSCHLSKNQQASIVADAVNIFNRVFEQESRSTVAPCYLWNDDTEQAWKLHGISYIQTAGYRCIGRDQQANYVQNPKIIRFGTKNKHKQIYLVRNVMYEPADGRTTDGCWREVVTAFRQCLPAAISTHRYNFTNDDTMKRQALAGLDEILNRIEDHYPLRRYIASPELGEWLETGIISNRFGSGEEKELPGIQYASKYQKIEGFLYRLWYRHAKIRLLVNFSGLILVFIFIIGVVRVLKKFF
ncbi:MAG: hypothetical protein GY777_31790 [Candidatus Brocadiaceae bacterium]|nr:hypothetical protein [Candidatus Brocadiaceae bacterium]